MLVRIAKLIADVRGHARFNAACPQQIRKSDRQHRSLTDCDPTEAVSVYGERKITEAVDDRQPEIVRYFREIPRR